MLKVIFLMNDRTLASRRSVAIALTVVSTSSLLLKEERDETARVERTPMIAITTIVSVNVKPFRNMLKTQVSFDIL